MYNLILRKDIKISLFIFKRELKCFVRFKIHLLGHSPERQLFAGFFSRTVTFPKRGLFVDEKAINVLYVEEMIILSLGIHPI